MDTKSIYYIDRYTGETKREQVLGEAALRWVYGTGLGKLSLHLLIKRGIFSRLLGWMKSRPASKKDILPFIEQYGINMDEAELTVDDYAHFNDFFYRKLKADARPLCGAGEVALPADARHQAWQNASEIEGVFVKGQKFDLPALLGSEELAERYAGGSIVLSRLCPVDYHRFHFPLAGTAQASRRIDGALASVSPYCLRSKLAWLWTNKRELTHLQTEEAGDVLLLPIGATGVGAIHQTYTAEQRVEKGDEQGYFAFGGSTVVSFYLPNRVKISQDLLDNTARGYETYARQGDVLGRIIRE